jgi:hypothetical protein
MWGKWPAESTGTSVAWGIAASKAVLSENGAPLSCLPQTMSTGRGSVPICLTRSP